MMRSECYRCPVKQGSDTHLPTSSKHVYFQRNAFILTVFQNCPVRFFAFFRFCGAQLAVTGQQGKGVLHRTKSTENLLQNIKRHVFLFKIKGFQTASTKSALLFHRSPVENTECIIRTLGRAKRHRGIEIFKPFVLSEFLSSLHATNTV